MFKDKRIPRILQLRREGFTLRTIGKMFGVTGARIRQLEAKGVRILRRERERAELPYSSDSLKHLDLSTRARNCLRNINVATLSELMGIDAITLLRVRNLGVATLEEIEREIKRYRLRMREQG